MLKIKVMNFSILILSFYFITTTECVEFNYKEGQKLVNGVFDYIKPMFKGDKQSELSGYSKRINEAKTPGDLVTKVNNELTQDRMQKLVNIGFRSRNGLITKIDEFTGKYNLLLTESNNGNQTVPFQDLKEKLAGENARQLELQQQQQQQQQDEEDGEDEEK